MQNRSIPMCIVLSIVTCGIYGIYWYYQIACDIDNQQPPLQNKPSTSPVVTILLFFVTCGLYSIYVNYVWGKSMPEIFARYGRPCEDRSGLYILLSIFGLDLIVLCLIQNDLNLLSAPPAAPYAQ